MNLFKFRFHHQEKDSAVQQMVSQLDAVKRADPAVLASLDTIEDGVLKGLSRNEQLKALERQIEASIRFVQDEPHTPGEIFHSRDPIGGLIQSVINDNVLPQAQSTGQGNPIVWIPAGIDGILEHFRPKFPFKIATAASRIEFPARCKVALLGDWGASNIHAKRLGDLAVARGADYVIHLGDIYYAGAKGECEDFVKNWPLRGDDGQPLIGRSFALNGNHEMYSVGNYYFTTVLDAFHQEASYFTLYNKWWQIQGLDTAYVPFTIDGGGKDDRLKVQWEWLMESIRISPEKKNIFLSHNQPVSAHLPELEAAQTLNEQWWKIVSGRDIGAAFAWFFGHEHRCIIYDDSDSQCHFKARLIGNGSIPHLPEREIAAAVAANGAKANAVWRVNHGTVGDGATAISTFALLSFDGDQCVAEYINEDGSLFYKENLTGGPNCEIR